MSNEIDELMDRDPLELSDRDLDGIIAYHRMRRAERAKGKSAKPTKESGPKVDLSAVLKRISGDKPKTTPPKTTVLRRV